MLVTVDNGLDHITNIVVHLVFFGKTFHPGKEDTFASIYLAESVQDIGLFLFVITGSSKPSFIDRRTSGG